MRKVKFEFSLSGLLIGLVIISMFAGLFGILNAEVVTNYNSADSFNLSSYDQIQNINNNGSVSNHIFLSQ